MGSSLSLSLSLSLDGVSSGIEISTPADHFDPRFDATSDDERPRCAEGSDILGDKNAQIDELCLRFGVTRQHVSLIDDDANNVHTHETFTKGRGVSRAKRKNARNCVSVLGATGVRYSFRVPRVRARARECVGGKRTRDSSPVSGRLRSE